MLDSRRKIFTHLYQVHKPSETKQIRPSADALAAPDLLHCISRLCEPLHEKGQRDGPVRLLREVDAIPAHAARRVRAHARARRAAHHVHVEVVRAARPAARLEKRALVET